MAENVFKFKRFSVSHAESSMKVGVDAVLLGSWISDICPKNLLEVGCGCGVISLILAQRLKDCDIRAIDIHARSVEESIRNFSQSEWQVRLMAERKCFPQEIITEGIKYDLIVSNPPYFLSGILQPLTPRERARHQGTLSVFSLLENAGAILNPGGRLAVIFPADQYQQVVDYSKLNGMKVLRECRVRNSDKRPFKRVMLEFGRESDINKGMACDKESISENLTLFAEGEPTSEYIALCKDFYMKF